jgi:predicted house-cleaning noncanonical NTP pyrophosphatase (MazG superfamily)
MIVPKIRDRIEEIIANDGTNWMSFIQSLKGKYFMEDIELVFKR